MANEVFISYSRIDYNRVISIKKEIDKKVGLDCWMDITGIESGDKFASVIISAINRHDTMLFMCSKNSMQSEWALDELDFAKRKQKRVVIINIDGSEMNDEFEFKYHKYDMILWDDPIQHDKLLSDLSNWFGKSRRKYPSIFSDYEIENNVSFVYFLVNRSFGFWGEKMDIINEACENLFKDFDIINPDVDILLNVLSYGGTAIWMKAFPTPIEVFKWSHLEPYGQNQYGDVFDVLNTQLNNINNNLEFKCRNRMPPLILLISDGDTINTDDSSLQQLLQNPSFIRAEKYAISIGEKFTPAVLKAFTGKKSKVFRLSEHNNAKQLEMLIERIMKISLYAGSHALFDDEDDNYPILNEL